MKLVDLWCCALEADRVDGFRFHKGEAEWFCLQALYDGEWIDVGTAENEHEARKFIAHAVSAINIRELCK